MLQRISELAEDVMWDFPSVDLRLIDLASPLGFLKGLKHGAGKGTVVLIDGRKVFDRIPDYESLKRELIKAGADTGIACPHRAVQKLGAPVRFRGICSVRPLCGSLELRR